ncbi:M14 family metallopeptidase [Flavobacteriaceae bacterium MHTCC 0001]
MGIEELQLLYKKHKEEHLNHRYITNTHIKPLLLALSDSIEVKGIGTSVLGDDIYAINIGSGSKRVLMWSQMHGNESTTTKAVFDFLNTCISGSLITDKILEMCTLCIIPILNPDGAKAYTRVNANNIDLNRDAQQLSQPESKVLRKEFERFKPHFCYNLHGQRTIFSAGSVKKSAIVSFLAPAQDKECTITENRKVAMDIIAEMNAYLQQIIPGQVGVYDDAFNINCVGDTFQSENVPTILFEAGHFPDDYPREKTRELIYISYITSLLHISSNEVSGRNYQPYFNIPQNGKLFFDIIIRNARLEKESNDVIDIAFQFKEKLIGNSIQFIPILQKLEKLPGFFGHKEIDAEGGVVLNKDDEMLEIGSENVFVKLNNEKITLFLK